MERLVDEPVDWYGLRFGARPDPVHTEDPQSNGWAEQADTSRGDAGHKALGLETSRCCDEVEDNPRGDPMSDDAATCPRSR